MERLDQTEKKRRHRTRPTLSEILAAFDGERESRNGVFPDFGKEAARLEALLAQAGLAISPLQDRVPDPDRAVSRAQIGSALCFLGWTTEDLCRSSGLSRTTVADILADRRMARPTTLQRIASALRAAGLQFTFGPDGETGVTFHPDRGASKA